MRGSSPSRLAEAGETQVCGSESEIAEADFGCSMRRYSGKIWCIVVNRKYSKQSAFCHGSLCIAVCSREFRRAGRWKKEQNKEKTNRRKGRIK